MNIHYSFSRLHTAKLNNEQHVVLKQAEKNEKLVVFIDFMTYFSLSVAF